MGGVTGIVLPLLPNEPIEGFFGVLRPRDVWRMVVLISGVSFVGYALMRLRAGRSGHAIMGFLGGLVSSTATAITYTRAAREAGDARHYETLVVLAASAAFFRVGFMLAIINPSLLPHVVLPLGAMFAVGMLFGFVWRQPGDAGNEPSAYKNPLRMRLAFTFAGLYATILVLVAAARDLVGETAVYILSAIAALGGADAPSLSLARLASDGQLDLETASVAVVVVAVTTTLGKAVIVVGLGGGTFARRVAPALLTMAIVGIVVLRFV